MSEPEHDAPLSAPGWAALDRHLSRAYPGRVPHQFTSATAYDLESKSPLPAIHAFEAGGPDHWHYVAYGLSELFEKSSPHAERSGFGLELTMRLQRGAEERPPEGPLRLLQALGHYALSRHADLDTGHCIDLGGPLWPGAETELTGVVLIPDPTLGELDTPNGRVLFLQLLPLTGEELEKIGTWTLEAKIGLAREAFGLGVTELDRSSILHDPRRAPIFRRWDCGVLI